MGRNCHRKYHETGLWFQIKTVEEIIATKERLGKDASFEKKLLKSWRKFQDKQSFTSATGKIKGIDAISNR